MKTITEGKATITAPQVEIVHKKLEVFYNPLMKLNRDMTLLLLQALEREALHIADPLAGSGVRSIRMLQELPQEMIHTIYVNDYKEGFTHQFKKNMHTSNCESNKVSVSEEEASTFLLKNKAFDYIDIDPFGSPNQFLDAAIKRTRRKGILAITATDTAPLCGTYPKACKRKYWATPRRDHLMHEYGLRILIRKCQLVGAQYDKALTPIFSYSKHHYFRIFFRTEIGKTKVDDILQQHETIDSYGPLWTGTLGEAPLINKMLAKADETYKNFLTTLHEEVQLLQVGFYDVHELSRALKLGAPPKSEHIHQALQKKGYTTSKTHFSPLGIKTNADEETIKKIMQGLV